MSFKLAAKESRNTVEIMANNMEKPVKVIV